METGNLILLIQLANRIRKTAPPVHVSRIDVRNCESIRVSHDAASFRSRDLQFFPYIHGSSNALAFGGYFGPPSGFQVAFHFRRKAYANRIGDVVYLRHALPWLRDCPIGPNRLLFAKCVMCRRPPFFARLVSLISAHCVINVIYGLTEGIASVYLRAAWQILRNGSRCFCLHRTV